MLSDFELVACATSDPSDMCNRGQLSNASRNWLGKYSTNPGFHPRESLNFVFYAKPS
jgi:hypothetical protein